MTFEDLDGVSFNWCLSAFALVSIFYLVFQYGSCYSVQLLRRLTDVAILNVTSHDSAHEAAAAGQGGEAKHESSHLCVRKASMCVMHLLLEHAAGGVTKYTADISAFFHSSCGCSTRTILWSLPKLSISENHTLC